jgi:glucosamine kinase
MQPLILGVDGGGTKTRVVVCQRDGVIVGRGEAGGFNLNNASPERCAEHLQIALKTALGKAPFPTIDSAFFGVCGVKDKVDEQAVRAVISQAGLSCHQLVVANDLSNVLAAGVPDGPALALIAGTGSHGVARDAQDRLTWCGGWGCVLDDVGSGYFLGKRGLQALTKAADGRGPKTLLSKKLLAALELDEASSLLRKVSDPTLGTAGIAALAPHIIAAAQQKDPVAQSILQEGAEGLAQIVHTLAQRSVLPASVPIVLAGGVARSGRPYQTMIQEAIGRYLPQAQFPELILPLECGAAALALKQAGHALTPTMIKHLQSSYPPSS